MIGAKVYNYLTELLATAIEADFGASTPRGKDKYTYDHYGVYHKQISKKAVATMSHFFEKNICRADKPVVLADAEGCLYAFNGEYYDAVGAGMSFITELVKRTMSHLKIAEQYIFYAPQYIAKEIHRTLTNSDEYLYKPDRRYIVFRNGVFDVEQGKLKKFDMRYTTDIVLDIDYADLKTLYKECADRFGISREENPYKLWEWKVEEIIPEREMRDAFQMFCGSLLINREVCKVEYVCYLIGSGSNGKSVLASVIAGVFGEQYFSRFSPKQLFKDSDARVNIAALLPTLWETSTRKTYPVEISNALLPEKSSRDARIMRGSLYRSPPLPFYVVPTPCRRLLTTVGGTIAGSCLYIPLLNSGLNRTKTPI